VNEMLAETLIPLWCTPAYMGYVLIMFY